MMTKLLVVFLGLLMASCVGPNFTGSREDFSEEAFLCEEHTDCVYQGNADCDSTFYVNEKHQKKSRGACLYGTSRWGYCAQGQCTSVQCYPLGDHCRQPVSNDMRLDERTANEIGSGKDWITHIGSVRANAHSPSAAGFYVNNLGSQDEKLVLMASISNMDTKKNVAVDRMETNIAVGGMHFVVLEYPPKDVGAYLVSITLHNSSGIIETVTQLLDVK